MLILKIFAFDLLCVCEMQKKKDEQYLPMYQFMVFMIITGDSSCELLKQRKKFSGINSKTKMRLLKDQKVDLSQATAVLFSDFINR